MEPMAASNNIPTLCRELDSVLAREKVSPEDVDKRSNLLRPLERAITGLPSPPAVPDTAAGKIAIALWFKSHPQQANLEDLINLIDDESPLVRLSAVDAVVATLNSSNERWREPQFFYLARQVILHSREAETSPVIAYQKGHVTDQIAKLSAQKKSKRPKVVLNPYVAGLPVQGRENFFGREDILRDIKNHLSKREGVKSIVLYGARRTGKTSVLYQIRDGVLGDSFLPVYLNMQQLAGMDSNGLLRALVNNTQEAMRERLGLPAEKLPPAGGQIITFTELREFLRTVLAMLDDTALLLMIDEYEVLQDLLADKDVVHQLQSLLEQESKLYVLFTGSQKLESLKQSRLLVLVDNARYIKISFLKPEETLRLIREPSQGMLEFMEGVPEQIGGYTAGHPFYTQLLCQAIFDNVKAGGKVEPRHVDEAVQQFLQNPSPHLILTWNGMEPLQKVVGSTLAALQGEGKTYQTPQAVNARLKLEEYPVKFVLGEIQQALTELCNIDWVERKTGESSYRFTMGLVRRWVADSRSIVELAEEQRKQLLSKIAGFWPQLFALLADWFIFLAIFLALYAVIGNSPVEMSASMPSVVALAAVLYFVLPISTARSTLGLRFFNLRVVSTSALSLKWGRAILYGLSLIVRCFVMLLLAKHLFQLADPDSGGFSLWGLVIIFGTALLMALDVVMMLYGQKHQGLYERLARTLLVPSSAIRD
jgi:uncharacterized RDD family membrane protein YckC